MKKEITKLHNYSKLPDYTSEQACFKHLLGQHLKGIDATCSQVASLMATHVIQARLKSPPTNSRCLLIGPTSSGKTSLASEAARILNVPFVTVNCTALTPEGYKGTNLSESLQTLIHQAGSRGLNYAEKNGIILLDEFDKLWKCPEDSLRKSVLTSLLPLLGGEPMLVAGNPTNIQISGSDESLPLIQFRTKNLMIICAGVFEKMRITPGNSLDKTSIALLRYGVPTELCSRLTHVISLKKPEGKVIEEIVEQFSADISKLYTTNTELIGLTPKSIKSIARVVAKHPLGLRLARSLLHRAFYQLTSERNLSQ